MNMLQYILKFVKEGVVKSPKFFVCIWIYSPYSSWWYYVQCGPSMTSWETYTLVSFWLIYTMPKGMCKPYYSNQDFSPLANWLYFKVIVKKIPLHNENSPIMDQNGSSTCLLGYISTKMIRGYTLGCVTFS